jgi:hypothetical protein
MDKYIDCKITRQESTDEGTFGIFSAPELGFNCLTIELPDRDNQPFKSRVLPGLYMATWSYSQSKDKWTYKLENKNGRAGIRLHSASFAGDIDKGYECDLEGCIALGSRTLSLTLQNQEIQQILTDSKITMREFERLANKRPLLLTIE